tara:strand:- start:555 stop:932 length:378 start_codon:yes stop_codon:yes gene_type:complete
LALKAEESSGRKAIIAAFLKHNGQAEWNATNFLGVISDIVAIKCKPSAPSWSAAGQNPLRQRWGLELAQAKAQPGQHVPAGHYPRHVHRAPSFSKVILYCYEIHFTTRAHFAFAQLLLLSWCPHK